MIKIIKNYIKSVKYSIATLLITSLAISASAAPATHQNDKVLIRTSIGSVIKDANYNITLTDSTGQHDISDVKVIERPNPNVIEQRRPYVVRLSVPWSQLPPEFLVKVCDEAHPERGCFYSQPKAKPLTYPAAVNAPVTFSSTVQFFQANNREQEEANAIRVMKQTPSRLATMSKAEYNELRQQQSQQSADLMMAQVAAGGPVGNFFKSVFIGFLNEFPGMTTVTAGAESLCMDLDPESNTGFCDFLVIDRGDDESMDYTYNYIIDFNANLEELEKEIQKVSGGIAYQNQLLSDFRNEETFRIFYDAEAYLAAVFDEYNIAVYMDNLNDDIWGEDAGYAPGMPGELTLDHIIAVLSDYDRYSQFVTLYDPDGKIESLHNPSSEDIEEYFRIIASIYFSHLDMDDDSDYPFSFSYDNDDNTTTEYSVYTPILTALQQQQFNKMAGGLRMWYGLKVVAIQAYRIYSQQSPADYHEGRQKSRTAFLRALNFEGLDESDCAPGDYCLSNVKANYEKRFEAIKEAYARHTGLPEAFVIRDNKTGEPVSVVLSVQTPKYTPLEFNKAVLDNNLELASVNELTDIFGIDEDEAARKRSVSNYFLGQLDLIGRLGVANPEIMKQLYSAFTLEEGYESLASLSYAMRASGGLASAEVVSKNVRASYYMENIIGEIVKNSERIVIENPDSLFIDYIKMYPYNTTPYNLSSDGKEELDESHLDVDLRGFYTAGLGDYTLTEKNITTPYVSWSADKFGHEYEELYADLYKSHDVSSLELSSPHLTVESFGLTPNPAGFPLTTFGSEAGCDFNIGYFKLENGIKLYSSEVSHCMEDVKLSALASAEIDQAIFHQLLFNEMLVEPDLYCPISNKTIQLEGNWPDVVPTASLTLINDTVPLSVPNGMNIALKPHPSYLNFRYVGGSGQLPAEGDTVKIDNVDLGYIAYSEKTGELICPYFIDYTSSSGKTGRAGIMLYTTEVDPFPLTPGPDDMTVSPLNRWLKNSGQWMCKGKSVNSKNRCRVGYLIE
ncbi:MAG: hypothetical protein AAGA27_04885 [Pseudomonadota bacterium]